MVAACGGNVITSGNGSGISNGNDRNIFAFDLRRGALSNKMTHPLRMQLRAVACFTSADGQSCFSFLRFRSFNLMCLLCCVVCCGGVGYVVGSVEGRCAVNYVPANTGKDFAFKCHRDGGNNAWAVNTVSFHPGHGTFATGSSHYHTSFTFYSLHQHDNDNDK
jgi:hypothetical protein